jgi:uncharacterized repeat protein (TIGR01451 family)
MKTLLKLTLIASALIAATAMAQEEGHLNVRTLVQKEEVTVNASGETERRLVAVDAVVPGEDVVYTITFTNVSDESAENVVITNPISASLTYVAGSAFGPGTVIEFSVDGGQTFAVADQLRIDTSEGERVAEVEDFTHVRWTMQDDLVAGAQGMARFRARLN